LTSAETRNLQDGQLFYIIKNGLGFTPMPSYASQFSDQQIWELVSFIRSLQAGNAPELAVPTPTGAQLSVANPPPGGDATRGAALFAAEGCAACHGPTGPLSINPANDAVARTVREGKPQGMPCFTPAALPDDQLHDIQAYIATFPPTGFLGGPEDVPPPRPPGATPAPRGGVGSPCATPTPGAASAGTSS
jgi:mono/diheme cytochrome c family protein